VCERERELVLNGGMGWLLIREQVGAVVPSALCCECSDVEQLLVLEDLTHEGALWHEVTGRSQEQLLTLNEAQVGNERLVRCCVQERWVYLQLRGHWCGLCVCADQAGLGLGGALARPFLGTLFTWAIRELMARWFILVAGEAAERADGHGGGMGEDGC
jgi:hypothetical protein